ncbi:MAG: hypothetical protein CR993_04660 [Rhodobacterales bacterium]|nr:MAG: hypothetical protein CR993_04660 [Rhodobacterales bacterium]
MAAFVATIIVILGGISLAKGGFFLGKHEGDTLHLLQMVLRMGAGDWPHLDFQTPIGVLAMAPMAVFVAAGWGAGSAIIAGQILMAVLLAPAIWYVAKSRFPGGFAYAFAAVTLVLILALVHGETERSVSISMHYNRWAWAISFLAISLAAMTPLGRARPVLDGAVLGLALAALGLIKVTYFAAFFPVIVIALIYRRASRTLLTGLIAGLAAMALVTLLAGTPLFWLAYMRDLATVSASEVRPNPGLPFLSVLGAPAYAGASLVLIGSVIALRQGGLMLPGLITFLLAPGFFYVTYQNYGNDPQWLPLFALMLGVWAREAKGTGWFGVELRKALTTATIIAATFATPSLLNLAYSPLRHFSAEADNYIALLPGSGVHEDLRTVKLRARRLDAKIALDEPGMPFETYFDEEFRNNVTEWQGERLPGCALDLGLVGWFDAIAHDLETSGLIYGKSIFAADLLNSYWMFGAGTPLKGSSPWYYGGLPGFQNADYLLIPLCPLSPRVRKLVLEAVEETGAELTEVRSNEVYRLYEINLNHPEGKAH